jgi:hypothetical protein
MDKVTFTEKDHKYTHYTGKQYISTTTVVSKYKQPFDAEYWSLYKAIQRYFNERLGPGEFEKIKKQVGWENIIPTQLKRIGNMELLIKFQDEILDQWEEEGKIASTNGTKFHKEKEFETNSQKLDLNYNLPIQISNRDLANLADGVYAELVVYNEQYEVAGQADKVIRQGKYVDIDDYKTSKKIDRKSFYHYLTGHKMMLEPLNNLMDCHLMHYTMQLSVYGYMLEQFGMKVRRLRIYHQPLDEWIVVDYLKSEVIKMLKHYNKTKLTLNEF